MKTIVIAFLLAGFVGCSTDSHQVAPSVTAPQPELAPVPLTLHRASKKPAKGLDEKIQDGSTTYYIESKAAVVIDRLVSVDIKDDKAAGGQSALLTLTPDEALGLKALTRKSLHKYVAVKLGSEVLTVPVVQAIVKAPSMAIYLGTNEDVARVRIAQLRRLVVPGPLK